MEKFADSQQQEAWRAYACAALQGLLATPSSIKGGAPVYVEMSVGFADRMMAEEMKRR